MATAIAIAAVPHFASPLTLPSISASRHPRFRLRVTHKKLGHEVHHHRRRRRSPQVIACSSTSEAQTEVEEANYAEIQLKESIGILKKAAKTRKVAAVEVFGAMRVLEKAKLDPSNFLSTIGGSVEAPGPRTWMLIFTSSKQVISESMKGGPGGGSYFPLTAVQKFDANAMTIENGVYLGALGYLTFQGRMSWNKRILAFLFESINIKVGGLGPFKFNIQKKEDQGRLPTTKDPFFIWFYADEEIIVARGRGGGMALWCRCTRVSQP